MSDLSDRGRRRRKRGIKVKEPGDSTSISRPPIILTKPQADRGGNSSTESMKLATKIPAETMPTVILRSRDDGGGHCSPQLTPLAASPITIAAAPSCGSGSISLSPTGVQSTSSYPVYQIQQKSAPSTPVTTTSTESSIPVAALESRLAPPKEMKAPVKLVDDNLQWCDAALEFLQDQTDYFVIGVIGMQGVGKSTLMSYLAGNKLEDSLKSFIFRVQGRETRELGEHTTSGIDAYITQDRILLLDVQPMLSPAIMDHMTQYDKKYVTDFSSVDNAIEMQSLQMTSFLLAVCHVVLLVQNWFTDANLLRFILTAEMLKPSPPAPLHDLAMDENLEQCAHLVFVHTRCSRQDFTPARLRSMQDTYRTIFQKSKLKFKGPISIAQGYIMPSLTQETAGDPINIFLIPERQNTEADIMSHCFPAYQGHPGYATLVQELCHQVYSLPRHSLMHNALSEKNWFHYAARTWELVKKSNLFMEYGRLLP